MTSPVYLNGVNTSDLNYIMLSLGGNNPVAPVTAVGGPSESIQVTLGNYAHTAVGDIQSALDAFIAAVGFPWIAVGTVADMTWVNGSGGIIAVNVDQPTFAFSDAGTGITFPGSSYPSIGYAPWADYASAAAAIGAMARMVTWSPSS